MSRMMLPENVMQNRCPRRAVTLIELLVVMAMILLLAGLTLPSVKNMMKDQRISQAARTMQGFLESAKARAIAQNRPVAAILERVGTSDTDVVGLQTCLRLTIGEVFPPYEGDWSNATGVLSDTNSDGYGDSLLIPAAQVASLVAPNFTLVTAGDTIQIGDRSFYFEITSAPSQVGTNVVIPFQNPPVFKSGGNKYNKEEPKFALTGATPSMKFRIFRKPSKTMASAIQMPKGTAVDLGWSGFGLTGTDVVPAPTPPPAPLNPATRSIYVVFNARGTVDTIYEFRQNTAAAAVSSSSSSIGLLHFMVGRSDQVGLTAADAVSERDDIKSNLLDTGNRWVTLNTINGQIYSSDVAPADTTTILTALSTARTFATLNVSAKDQ